MSYSTNGAVGGEATLGRIEERNEVTTVARELVANRQKPSIPCPHR